MDGSTPGAQRFRDPDRCADGQPRAKVAPGPLRTLWFNTGTLCNITCAHCYIESSPTNDALVYLTAADVRRYLDEIAREGLPVEELGFTGGEPFMNPDIIDMLADGLSRGFRCLVLTNAMRPMMRPRVQRGLLALRAAHGRRLVLRVSLDHHDPARHDEERGAGSFARSLEGLRWLARNGFEIAIAARSRWDDSQPAMRAGFARLLAREGISLDAQDPARLVIFPEMDEGAEVPEITTACWGILGKSPESVMCASSRMVVRRKGAPGPAVVACTLLPYDPRFELGATLAEAARPVALLHPHCARFCVLGGGSCSG